MDKGARSLQIVLHKSKYNVMYNNIFKKVKQSYKNTCFLKKYGHIQCLDLHMVNQGYLSPLCRTVHDWLKDLTRESPTNDPIYCELVGL